MTKDTFIRKAKIAYLNGRIGFLRYAMDQEGSITEQWKRMARRQAGLIRRRNDLLTPDELRAIERQRGLV